MRDKAKIVALWIALSVGLLLYYVQKKFTKNT